MNTAISHLSWSNVSVEYLGRLSWPQYKRTTRLSHHAGVHIAKARDAGAITKTGVRRQLPFKAVSPDIPAPYDATLRGARRHPEDREDLMRKSLVAWSIACSMLAAGTVARAEMAAPAGPTLYGETINIEQAKKIAAAAAAEAK